MAKVYGLYEAKARLSEIIRRVRENGESVTISYHGEPVAEIRPIEPVAKKKGALKRFLATRLMKAAYVDTSVLVAILF